LGDTVTVRAALHLCRDYGQEPLVQSLTDAARPPRKDTLRGLATAALYDCGRRSEALALARDLETTRHLPALCWSGLVQATEAGVRPGAVVSELVFRRVEQGACE
jgi:hypothetical protein